MKHRHKQRKAAKEWLKDAELTRRPAPLPERPVARRRWQPAWTMTALIWGPFSAGAAFGLFAPAWLEARLIAICLMLLSGVWPAIAALGDRKLDRDKRWQSFSDRATRLTIGALGVGMAIFLGGLLREIYDGVFG